jgi:hypothetical protein
MRTDLRYSLNEGLDHLYTWRNRYSKSEYPEKVVLNIFYKKYTLEFMFPDIIDFFKTNLFGKQKIKWSNVDEGLVELKKIHDTIKMTKTQPHLLNLLKDIKRPIGNTSYEVFIPLISAAKRGDSSKLEEIEFSYMYYLLTDVSILIWGAFGGTGLSKIDSISKMTGLILKTPEIKTYSHIEDILGQYCVAPYLNDNYKKLPPNF